MSASDVESDASFVRVSSECDPEDVGHVDKTNVEKLISLRKNINWEIEEERHKLLDQLYTLIRNWEGQLPHLSEIFQPEEFDWLLAQDAYNETDTSGVPFIDFVIRTGYKYNPDLDKDGKPLLHRTTAVHRASRSYRYQICENIPELFKIYDYVNYIDDFGYTHFHVACENDCDQVVKKFLELGQDPNCLAQKSVDPPLHLALKYGQKRVVELLLKSGADVNLANKNGLTPLHVICKEGELEELFFKINDELKKPIKVNAQDRFGRTPLFVALTHGKQKVAELLLRRGADRNLATKHGLNPLHIICMRSDGDELVKVFFEISDAKQQLVNVDAMDYMGRTPLQWAVASLLPDVVEFLLNHGAEASNFIFPSEDYFAQRYKLDCTLQMVVFPTMSIIKSLESKGYELDQTAALTIMKTFAKHGLIDESVNLNECLRKDKEFVNIAIERMVNPSLALYNFLQLPPAKAEKVFTMKNYDQYTYEIDDLCDDSHRAFTTYLCETVTYGFFRRWALKLFSKKTPWLSKHYCEILMGHLNIKGLWDICMEAANENTQWLDSVRTDYVKKYYNRNLSLSYSSEDCYKS